MPKRNQKVPQMVSKPILKSFQKNPKSTPKQSETAPKTIRKTISKSHQNHPKSVPEVSRGNPCPVADSRFFIFFVFLPILWKRRSVWRPPFFSFRPLGSPKRPPMIIRGHLLAPGGRPGGANGHFWTCPKSAPEWSHRSS